MSEQGRMNRQTMWTMTLNCEVCRRESDRNTHVCLPAANLPGCLPPMECVCQDERCVAEAIRRLLNNE